mgnify:CR=1 FL=1
MLKQSTMFKGLFLLVGFLFALQLNAQDIKISGKVTDAKDSKTLPGVSIAIKGTAMGTTSDIDGKYSLSVKKGTTLVFSFIGYTPQEIAVGNQAVINVALAPSVTALDEVVVIGYGQVKKSDATGSVSVVNSKDFNKGAIVNAQQLIQGKTAGVTITSGSGAPDAKPEIRIRGISSLSASQEVLFIVDGVALDNATGVSGLSNPMSFINPNDIESITILKDASALAIYGSRASNGVILITTKKAKGDALSRKMSVSYNGSLSIGTPTKKVDVLNGDEFRELVKQSVADGLSGFTQETLTKLGTENTNWQDEIYRSAISHDHNVSMTGKVSILPYRASVGYTNNQGILKNTDLKRTTATLNLNPSFLDDHLTVDAGLKFQWAKQNFGNEGAVGAAIAYDPTQPIMNGNTRWGGYYTWMNSGEDINGMPNSIGVSNPVALIEQTDNVSDVKRIIANGKIDYKFHFLPELKATLNVAYDYINSDGHNISDTLTAWVSRKGEGSYIRYEQTKKNELLDFYLNYNKDLKDFYSKVDATVGHSWQHFYEDGKNLDTTYFGYENSNTSYKKENYLLSFFGRINYTFLDRYLLTATVRYDGTSKFSKDNRWGLFPSFAVAWKINEENFLKGVEEINELKLRLGYGTTGQQNVVNDWYPYMPLYVYGYTNAAYQFGDKWYQTYRPSAYNNDLKWEVSKTLNLGLDFSLFNERISGSVEVYKKNTDDMISYVNVPVGTNLSNYIYANVGSMENSGLEVTLNTKPVINKDLVWNLGVNFSYNKTEITKLTARDDPDYLGIPVGTISGGVGNTIQYHSVGYAPNSFFVFQQVYDADGNPIEGLYVDRSGEGGSVISSLDNKYHYKNPTPDVTIGINSSLRYKNWDASLSGRLYLGNYNYNNVYSDRALYSSIYNQSGFLNNVPTALYDTKFYNTQYFSDYYIENASFFRMDNISVGYNFMKLFGANLDGRVSFTCQNVFVITNYSGLDPEVTGGIDNNIYPKARTFVLGLNLNL